MDEFSLIERYFAPLAKDFPGALDLKDDAALVDVSPGCRLVMTKDAIIAGVHFFADDPPDLIARKLVRVNLSDLAAMGARPHAILLATIFPRDLDEQWLMRFGEGLVQDCRAFEIALIGGDTTATPGPLTLSLTAIGIVENGKEMRRSRAQPGDLVCVSGFLGDAALGLMALQGRLPSVSDAARRFLIDRYHIPLPRLALAAELAKSAHAGMDVSDGLPGDIRHICTTSGVGCVIDAAALPFSQAGREALATSPDLLPVLIRGGDDYELLLAIPPDRINEAQKNAMALNIPLTVIGAFTETQDVVFKNIPEGNDMASFLLGYQHFRGGSS